MSAKSLNADDLKLQEEILNKSLSWWEAETLKTVKKTEELEKAAIYRDVSEEEHALEGRMSYLIAKGEFESNELDLLEAKYNKFYKQEMARKMRGESMLENHRKET